MATQDPVLCYVEDCWAYFTTQELSKQWGDDWNDAPYEHNAEPPYGDHESPPKWEIYKVAFDGPFAQPCESFGNSPYCVQDINAGAVAWLRSTYSTVIRRETASPNNLSPLT